MAEFNIPEKIIYGGGAMESLREFGQGRMLIVSDNAGAGSELQASLQCGGTQTRLFLLDRRYADTASIMEGAKALMEFKPERMAAIGGHAAMDCGKLMRVFYERPELSPKDLQNGVCDLPSFRTSLAALPLLHSNGGEATDEAVLSSPEARVQNAVKCQGFMPNAVVLDTSLLRHARERDDAYAVISTLSLALEAATASPNSHFSRPLALEALRIITGSAMAFSLAPANPDELFYAQFLAGAAHANTAPGICGAMARASALTLGDGMPYGAASAIYLPTVLRSGFAAPAPVYEGIARAIGLKCSGSAAALLASTVEEYADMLGMPLTLEEYGVDKNLFLKSLSRISSITAKSLELHDDGQKRIEELFREAYAGKK